MEYSEIKLYKHHSCTIAVKRIITVLILLMFPSMCGIYALVGVIHWPQYWKKYLPFFIVATFSLAYAYVPGTSGCDLLRYFEQVREYAMYTSFTSIINYRGDGLIVRDIVFWIIGKTGDLHLLPSISTTIVYAVTGYISCSFASDQKCEKLIPVIFFLQIVLLPYSSVIDNVRNVCAFSMIVLAVYLDIIKGRHTITVALLYILPCFLHISGLVLVMFRIGVFIVKNKWAKISVSLAAIFFPILINFAYKNISLFSFGGSVGDIIQTGIWKAWRYYNTPGGLDEYERALIESRYEPVLRLFMMAFALVLLLLSYYSSRHEEKNVARFNSFIFLVCIMTLSCNAFITPHYWRFYCAAVIGCPIVLIPLIVSRNKLPITIKILLFSLIVFAIGGIAMNGWNLRTSVDWSEWIERFFLTNPYTVSFNLLGSLWKGV